MKKTEISVHQSLGNTDKGKAVFGIVGLGGIAQAQHLPNMVRAQHIFLKTICDKNEILLQETQKKYNINNSTTKYSDMLNDPKIEAICIATQEDVQASLTIKALKAGKHVYVEKPLARTAEECREVVKVQKETGKHVIIGFNRRRAPAFLKAKEIISNHGGAKNIHYRLSDPFHSDERVRVIREMCHIFDIVTFLADDKPISIYCVESRADEETYVIKFSSGTVASIIGTGYASRDVPKEHLEIFTGNMGGIMVEDFVELRTYGMEGVEHIQRFAGHSHPDLEFTHKYLFAIDGANALHSIRRMGWELEQRYAKDPNAPSFVDNVELEKYVTVIGRKQGTNPRWNYMMDKGWLSSVDYLGECILKNQKPVGIANSEDAWKASMLSHAAIKSRDSGEVIPLNFEL